MEGVAPNRAATIALGTRFFAPRTVISPLSGRPPRTWSNPSTIKYLRNDDVVAGTADAYERAR